MSVASTSQEEWKWIRVFLVFEQGECWRCYTLRPSSTSAIQFLEIVFLPDECSCGWKEMPSSFTFWESFNLFSCGGRFGWLKISPYLLAPLPFKGILRCSTLPRFNTFFFFFEIAPQVDQVGVMLCLQGWPYTSGPPMMTGFCGAGDWTQCFMTARQHSTLSHPFGFCYGLISLPCQVARHKGQQGNKAVNRMWKMTGCCDVKKGRLNQANPIAAWKQVWWDAAQHMTHGIRQCVGSLRGSSRRRKIPSETVEEAKQ